MGMNMLAYQLVNEYKNLSEVISIAIAGSGATGRKDSFSDINIYIITEGGIPIDKRKAIVSKLSDEKEINNTIWGDTDEFILRNSDIQIDVSYFDITWLNEVLNNIVIKCKAEFGYSTCFWHNVINSKIIYDKANKFKNFQSKYKVDYPYELKKNIVIKNYPILKDTLSSYYNQINKAIKRGDLISINTRISQFMASYFDIIFAINEIPHPGKNKLISIIESICSKKPKNFSKNILLLLKYSNECNEEILEVIDNIIENLNTLLRLENLRN